MVVLILKVGGYYHGIGLVDLVCKVVTLILDRCLTTSIYFHNVLHRLWAGRPQGQNAPECNSHKVGGPVCYLCIPEQVVCHLIRVKIPEDPIGIQSAAASFLHPPHLL